MSRDDSISIDALFAGLGIDTPEPQEKPEFEGFATADEPIEAESEWPAEYLAEEQPVEDPMEGQSTDEHLEYQPAEDPESEQFAEYQPAEDPESEQFAEYQPAEDPESEQFAEEQPQSVTGEWATEEAWPAKEPADEDFASWPDEAPAEEAAEAASEWGIEDAPIEWEAENTAGEWEAEEAPIEWEGNDTETAVDYSDSPIEEEPLSEQQYIQEAQEAFDEAYMAQVETAAALEEAADLLPIDEVPENEAADEAAVALEEAAGLSSSDEEAAGLPSSNEDPEGEKIGEAGMRDESRPSPPKKSKAPILILVAVLVACIGIAAAIFFTMGHNAANTESGAPSGQSQITEQSPGAAASSAIAAQSKYSYVMNGPNGSKLDISEVSCYGQDGMLIQTDIIASSKEVNPQTLLSFLENQFGDTIIESVVGDDVAAIKVDASNSGITKEAYEGSLASNMANFQILE